MNPEAAGFEQPEPSAVFKIHGPDRMQVPIVLDSPHSGARRPPDFGCLLSDEDLRDAQDAHIDTLYRPATELGICLLAAEYPRTYIDANRHEGDVDLHLLDGPWPGVYQPSGKKKMVGFNFLEGSRPKSFLMNMSRNTIGFEAGLGDLYGPDPDALAEMLNGYLDQQTSLED